jgi:HlyD family secretion protein
MRLRVGAAVAMLALTGCGDGHQSPPLRVSTGTFRQTITLTGELEARRGVAVSVPRLPSWESSIKWMVEDGTFVRAGDRVVELDAGQMPAQLETMRQTETQAVQELQQRNAEWAADLEQKQLELDKKLAELEKARTQSEVPKEILAPREYEQRQLALQKATAEVEKARDLLASQRSAVDSERSNIVLRIEKSRREIARSAGALDSLFILAPQDGIFVVRELPWESRTLRIGDRVWVGFALGSMPDLRTLQVTAALADVDDGRVSPGMRARITLDGYPGEQLGGRVVSVAAVAQDAGRNSQRRFIRVVVALDRVDPDRMRPGLSAKVEVTRDERPQVLLVPRQALRIEGSAARVALADGTTKSIRIGTCNARECVVTSGLAAGDELRPFEEDPHA